MAELDVPHVAAAINAAAFPDAARHAVDALVEGRPDVADLLADHEVVARAVVALADASRSLSGVVRADPSVLDVVVRGDLDIERDLDWYVPAGRAAVDGTTADDALRSLRRWKRSEYCRIAVRDLLGYADMPAVGREVSALAVGCLDAALCASEVDGRFAILGMGKLAGRELNYASDVDVVFVHEGDLEPALRAARSVITTMTRHTDAGIVFRTDADLRPEGSSGPLSRTVGSYGAYFERWARPWERQAFLKSRFAAGDRDLANELFEQIHHFVWDSPLDPDDLRYLRQLKGRAEDAVKASGGRDLKRSPGGIRDVEFSVQLLELVHGRHDPTLRTPNTLEGLEQLARAGLVDRNDADHLDVAYRYLRTVEHRLQLRDERQTHELPNDASDLTWLARVLGLRDRGGESASEQFLVTHRRHLASVREIHERLFYRPVLEALASAGELPEALAERLAALGFREPEQAAQTLERLVAGLSRPARALRQVAPLLLDGLAASPDPDLGLIRLAWIADGPARVNAVAAAVRESPVAVRRLTWLLGSSRVVADSLRRNPEVLRSLADDDELDGRRPPEAIRADATDALSLRSDDAARADELRRFKRREELRVAVLDL
ncbi:MAG: hypothetical protein KDB21_00695, partial [Acidimicrobiales bacterium]|nr:hypothetical protein [Acidimicrobiales bacterium]